MFDLSLLPLHAAIFAVAFAVERGGELPDWPLALGCAFLALGTTWLLAALLPEGWTWTAWLAGPLVGVAALKAQTDATLRQSCAVVVWFLGVGLALRLVG